MSNDENINDSPINSYPGDMEERLWAYIDGISEEASLIETLVVQNREWKEKYAELLEVHQLLAATELEHPSLRFTKNVMEEVARYQVATAAKKYINAKIIWGIAAFFIIMIVGFVIYGIAQINWSEASDPKSTFGIDLSAIDFSRMFDNNILNGFMMLNVLLGLLLLDRYLNSKRKRFQEI